MTLPYFLKLLCLGLAAFFLVHTGAAALIFATSGAALRLAEKLRPRAAAHFLLALRLLPVALALFVVLGLCVPSYLWLEPEETTEQVGVLCMATALMGAAIWARSIARSLRAVAGSVRYTRRFLSAGREIRVAGESLPVVSIEDEAALVVLVGVLRPRLVISRRVLSVLSTKQLAVALRHERAHRVFHDNFKHLLLLLSPDVLPFARGFAALERAWRKFSEWAADDEAAEGSARRSLLLAETLVRLARISNVTPPVALTSSLLPADHDLAARVDRLLHPGPPPEPRQLGVRKFFGAATLMTAGALAVVMMGAGLSLSTVHGLLERLVH